jgi:release factor glutamine methyltransferase
MTAADTFAGLLGAAHGTARLDAELLLAHICGVRRATLRAFPERAVDAASAEAFRRAVARRASGEPLAYITGTKEFYGLSLYVTPDVLVPRPETELLVDALLECMPAGRSVRVLDLGTGSGALALALKHERPVWDVTAVDVSAAALAVARRNGERLALAVRWLVSDGFAAFAASASDERFDAIVMNPPYVRSDDPALEAELEVEPRADAAPARGPGLAHGGLHVPQHPQHPLRARDVAARPPPPAPLDDAAKRARGRRADGPLWKRAQCAAAQAANVGEQELCVEACDTVRGGK